MPRVYVNCKEHKTADKRRAIFKKAYKLHPTLPNGDIAPMNYKVDDLPDMMVLDAFFNVAKLKIKSIEFHQQSKSQGRRRKHNIHITVMWGPSQRNAMIASPCEFMDWYNNMPSVLKQPCITLHSIIQNVILVAFKKYAPRTLGGMIKLMEDENNHRRYTYPIIRSIS